MNRSGEQNRALGAISTLGWPLLWGLALCSVFYVIIFMVLDRVPGLAEYRPFMQRYFAGHIVEYIETAMFFIGISALAAKAIDVLSQFSLLDQVSLAKLGPELRNQAGKCGVSAATTLLDRLEKFKAGIRRSYIGARLRDALESVERKGTAAGLDDELKYLADIQAERANEDYALARIITWATPMLGFLGTVVGITMALGGMSPESLVNEPQEAMKGLLGGLSVAFDTTALALSLSIVLMFTQFIVDRVETKLLEIVDSRAGDELIGLFEEVGAAHDPHVASVERMSQSVVRATGDLVEKQAEIWRLSMDAADNRWRDLVGAAGGELTESLQASLTLHAEQVQKSEGKSLDRVSEAAERFSASLSEATSTLRDQQSEMRRQGEVLNEAVRATGEVVRLEQALNDNLAQLAGVGRFEETVMTLSAAIQLLSARLSAAPTANAMVDLHGGGKPSLTSDNALSSDNEGRAA